VYLEDAGIQSDPTDAAGLALLPTTGRSRAPRTEVNGVNAGARNLIIGDIVRVTPRLTHDFALSGAYTEWYRIVGREIRGANDDFKLEDDYVTGLPKKTVPVGEIAFWANYFDYFSEGAVVDYSMFGTKPEVFKADRKSLTPTLYNYSYEAKASYQTAKYLGHYISATQGTDRTWISGTYQELLKLREAELYADGARYSVYLDMNGNILGGFTLSGGEYAVLSAPFQNINARTSIWQWANNRGSEPRAITYYEKSSFKEDARYITGRDLTPAERLTMTKSETDLYNGLLKSGVTPASDGQIVDIGYVARVWSGHAKILTGYTDYALDSNTLKNNGALYVQITYDFLTNKFIFTTVTAGEALATMRSYDRRNASYEYWVYVFEDEPKTSFVTESTVYVIDYTRFAMKTFDMPNVYGTGPGPGPVTDPDVDAVRYLINSLPASANPTAAEAEAVRALIEAARTLYDRLSETQQAQIPDVLYNKLLAYEAALPTEPPPPPPPVSVLDVTRTATIPSGYTYSVEINDAPAWSEGILAVLLTNGDYEVFVDVGNPGTFEDPEMLGPTPVQVQNAKVIWCPQTLSGGAVNPKYSEISTFLAIFKSDPYAGIAGFSDLIGTNVWVFEGSLA